MQITQSNTGSPADQTSTNDTAEPSSHNSDETVNTIERYFDLYKNGAITLAEYTTKKEELLGIAPMPHAPNTDDVAPVPHVQITDDITPVPHDRSTDNITSVTHTLSADDIAPMSHALNRENEELHCHNTIPIPNMTRVLLQGQKTALGLSKNNTAQIQVCIGWNVCDPHVHMTVATYPVDNDGRTVDSDESIHLQHTIPTERINVSIDFAKLPPSVVKIPIVLSIPNTLQSDISSINAESIWIRILRADNTEVMSFPISDYSSNTASMVLGEIYLHRDEWKFNPVGKGLKEPLTI